MWSRVLWITVLSAVVGGCVTSNNQSDGPSPIQVRRDQWIACVSNSYATQSKLTPDRSLAVEQAFLACRTEEAAIPGALGAGNLEFQVHLISIMAALKARVKRELIGASGAQSSVGAAQ